MKKFAFIFTLAAIGLALFAQPEVTTIPILENGIENLIVEKKDVSADAGAGMNRYRIYADLDATYGLSLVTGTPSLGDMSFTSTGTAGFFNSSVLNAVTGSSILSLVYSDPSVENDSYVTIGATGSDRLGVPYSVDPSGHVSVTSAPAVSEQGLSGAGAVSTSADFVSDPTNGASYYVTLGPGFKMPAPYDGDNVIMIGQFTCDGDFSFQVFIGTKDASELQNITGPYTFSTLVGPEPPTVAITAPTSATLLDNTAIFVDVLYNDANGDPGDVEYRWDNGDGSGFGAWTVASTGAASGSTVSIPVTTGADGTTNVIEVRATDVDGTSPVVTDSWLIQKDIVPASISSFTVSPAGPYFDNQTLTFEVVYDDGSADGAEVVKWFLDNVEQTASQGSLTFDLVNPSAGQHTVKVVVEGDGAPAEDEITVDIISSSASYQISSLTENCAESNTFCLDVTPIVALTESTIGFDLDVLYDPAKVEPTGKVTVYSNSTGVTQDNTESHYNINTDGVMHLSVALDTSSLGTTGWDAGTVNVPLFCIEFSKTGLGNAEATAISAENIYESYRTTVDGPKLASPGTYETFLDNTYSGEVKFWADNSPLYSAPGTFNIETYIVDGAPFTATNSAGEFVVNIVDHPVIEITKDVANVADGTNFMTIFNGYDSYLTALVLTNDTAKFVPNAFQMVAMDVNQDGFVAAGDLSHINQRAVETRYGWYSGASDWRFINEKSLDLDPTFRISSTYPNDDLSGYSKLRGPSVPGSFNLEASYLPSSLPACPTLIDNRNTYFGIMMGDIDGSYKSAVADGKLKSAQASSVVFDLNSAVYEEDFVSIPVFYRGEDVVNSFDFVMSYNRSDLTLQSVTCYDEKVETTFNEDGKYLYMVSYSLLGYNLDEAVFSVRFFAPDGLSKEDLVEAAAFINGVQVETAIQGNALNVEDFASSFRVYPNPADEYLMIEVAEEVSVELVDIQGRVLLQKDNVAGVERIDVSGFNTGMYIMKVADDSNVAVKRVVIE